MKKLTVMVILIGLPGSGKSTFYHRMFANTHLRVNLDMLKTRAREKALLEVCLATELCVVIDNTNVEARERARYITMAKARGFQVHGYYISSSVQRCLTMNSQRAKNERVAEVAILSKRKLLQMPHSEEGFDALFYVSPGEQGEFLVEDWKHE